MIGSVDTLAQIGDAPRAPAEVAEEAATPMEEPRETRGPITLDLPLVVRPKATDRTERPVPDVSGLVLRDAVRALHQSGFRVRVIPQRGSATLPAAGTPLAAGSIVKLQHIQ